MNAIAVSERVDRAALFSETAARRGVRPIIIEKDFWVCWTLKHLFELPDIGSHLIFKGGTTLSKVYKLIERFSEDIDISLNREWLGFGGENEPEAAPSKKKTQHRIEELQEASRDRISKTLLPALMESFENILGKQEVSAGDGWSLNIDPDNAQNLLFAYPKAEASRMRTTEADYLKPIVKIEMGARSDHWPAGEYQITPYAAEEFPNSFTNPSCNLKVLEVERTFWEKATILHMEYHRPDSSTTGRERLSRHYYDTYKLAISGVAQRALERLDILERVVEHKKIFFRSGWANYDEARGGQLRLMPAKHRITELKTDYERMRDMFFAKRPALDKVLDRLSNLETEINQIIGVQPHS